MVKHEAFLDEPVDPNFRGGNPQFELVHLYTADQPEVHEVIRGMRQLLDEYDDRMMVGEIYLPNERLMTYYGADLDECHLPFNFQLINAPWTAAGVRQLVDRYEADLPAGGWPNWVLGNHDQHRLATRVGAAQVRVATLLLLTLRGTPTCYYGDELGMADVAIPPELVQDPPAVRMPEIAHIVGRDPTRTPMQWDGSPNAGFAKAGVRPWLPLAPDAAVRNVAQQTAVPGSMLSFFRTLVGVRNASAALTVGAYRSLDGGSDEIFAYLRSTAAETLLVVLNFGAGAHQLDLSAAGAQGELLLSSGMDRHGRVALAALDVGPNEGLIVRVAGEAVSI